MTWVACAAVAVLADVLVSPYFEWLGMRPDVCVSTLALSWLAAHDERDHVWLAWGIGLLRDTLSVDPIGVHAFAFVTTAWAACKARKAWFPGAAWERIVFVGAAVACVGLAASLVGVAAGSPARPQEAAMAAAGSGLASAIMVGGPMEAWTRVRTWVRNGYERLQWQ